MDIATVSEFQFLSPIEPCTEGKCEKIVKCQRVLSADLAIRLNKGFIARS